MTTIFVSGMYDFTGISTSKGRGCLVNKSYTGSLTDLYTTSGALSNLRLNFSTPAASIKSASAPTWLLCSRM